MQTQPEKYQVSLENAKKSLEMADHLTYMTFPLIKENKLLLKILDELSNSIISIVNAILQYEYLHKRIQLYKDARENFRTFKEIAKKYRVGEKQLNKITELLTLRERHKKSPFEFVRKEKVIIMSDNLKTDILTIEKIKEFLLETKDFLRKVSLIIKPI